jgi:hypothetical protein
MSGINQSKITVTLRNPLDYQDLLEYYIIPDDNQLAQDWVTALTKVLQSNNLLEKNFCFLGFPKTARTLEYLCDELNIAIETINNFDFTKHGLDNYIIEQWFHPNTVRFSDAYKIEKTVISDQLSDNRPALGLQPKHTILNQLHNHFERLQGTVNGLSKYYRVADYDTKYAIRQLNIICHEMESLILSQRKAIVAPQWVRPSQITTFLHAERYALTDDHRQGFISNGYDRRFGTVYMHWTQIGKTLFEVWRDEGAPKLDATVCEAITHLEYYSGEFDVEWGKDVTFELGYPWHNKEQQEFKDWLIDNGLDPKDPKLSLGHLPVGHIDLQASFDTTDEQEIWDILSKYLDIYSISINGITNTFDYCWTDDDYKQKQIDMMRPGYDHSSRG